MEEQSQKVNLSVNTRIERDRKLINEARERGRWPLFGVFVRLSGPGWLQSAITLGGGTLSNSLYLAVLTGFVFLWLQPVAMVFGIVMLSAISYVTLSTGERPLRVINTHINPVLGWSWLLASMVANLVWSMPQFALGLASLTKMLFPGILGIEGPLGPNGKIVAALCILAINILFLTLYSSGGKGMVIFETLIKCMVGMTVLCFIGVVIVITKNGLADWRDYMGGFIPRFNMMFEPAPKLQPFLAAVPDAFRPFWEAKILGDQRDFIISAFATAVGINMTFMFPYSMMRKGWDRDFRGLAIFDLSTGLFIPFLIATSCVVIAAGTQLHAKPQPGLVERVDAQGAPIKVEQSLLTGYNGLLGNRLKAEIGEGEVAKLSPADLEAKISALPESERVMAAMLVRRDAPQLAASLEPLTGTTVARFVFGLGILGMGLSAATMLMIINSLCFCELLNRPAKGWPQFVGGAMTSISLFVMLTWDGALMAVATPTSVFCMTLLPLAYLSFFMLMNQKSVLKDSMPRGGKRVLWNTLMVIALFCSFFGGLWGIYGKAGAFWTVCVVVVFTVLVAAGHVYRKRRQQTA
ncbi:MAG TPA: divalent metal cation transporter [Candidatus Hydrogenedentes bacterium]|nr:divalent metal cation transporter [Candidatus Hydrogenedentota bacterium]HOH50002.1 divalent metal cation transporter [Candidatus Hydrogenedentota bacterium]HQL95422.1 divalent metal cation transporter [Candidatus Hydrogenedentota bacterium]